MVNLCGECNACCVALLIKGFKEADTSCEKLCDNQCSIYEERPPACVNYECLWLQLSKIMDLASEYRPDNIGVMVSTHYYEDRDEFVFTIRELEKERMNFNNLDAELEEFLEIIFKVSDQQKGTGVIAIKFFGQDKSYRLNQNFGG